jgi:1-phosphofructokinase
MLADGWATSEAESEVMRAMHDLRAAGAQHVVVSRAEAPSLVLAGDGVFRVMGPRFEAVDHRGAGDSLTAGIATGLARGLGLDAAVRLGTAAGTLNVTRHGLASGDGAAIAKFVEEVRLVPVSAVGAAPATAITPEALASKVRTEP